MGNEFTFDAERTSVRRVNVAENDILAAALPMWLRIVHALKHHPKALFELANELARKWKASSGRYAARKTSLRAWAMAFQIARGIPDKLGQTACPESRYLVESCREDFARIRREQPELTSSPLWLTLVTDEGSRDATRETAPPPYSKQG